MDVIKVYLWCVCVCVRERDFGSCFIIFAQIKISIVAAQDGANPLRSMTYSPKTFLRTTFGLFRLEVSIQRTLTIVGSITARLVSSLAKLDFTKDNKMLFFVCSEAVNPI